MTVQTITHITVYNSDDDSTTFIDRVDENGEPRISVVIDSDDENGIRNSIDHNFSIEEAEAVAMAILRQVQYAENDE